MPSIELDRLLAVAGEVFGRTVTLEDRFFDLGGDSVVLVEFTMRLEEATGVRIDLGSLFEKDTLAQLLPLLESSGADPAQ